MDDPAYHSLYCRTCRRALNVYTPANGLGPTKLVHSVEARGVAVDHKPDPVPLADLADPIIECDFCSGPASAVFLFPDLESRLDPITTRVVSLGDYQRRNVAARTLRTETTPGITNRYGRRWCACDGCAALVSTGDMWGLITRVTEHLPAKLTRGNRLIRTRGHLQGLYSGLFTGEPPLRGRITPDNPLGVWDPPTEPSQGQR